MIGVHQRFTPLQRLLHWLMAVCILAMLFIGVGMVSTTMPKYLPLVAIHKSLGIAILVLALIRLAPRPVTEIRAQPPARPRRISFNDRRALEMLPTRIAELQTQITGLNAVLADPDLYARDPGRFVATSQALAIARDELAAAEEQWLTLEMLREQIDDDERKS